LRRYETIYITDPELPDEQVTGMVDLLTTAITEHKGELVKTEDWGRKKLAYAVRKRREGRYVRLEYDAVDGTLTAELERRLRMSETVLKFMTIRMDDDKKRLVWEAKQAVKEEERAARRAIEVAAAEAAAAEEAAKAEAEGTAEVAPDAGDGASEVETAEAGASATESAIRPDAGQEG